MFYAQGVVKGLALALTITMSGTPCGNDKSAGQRVFFPGVAKQTGTNQTHWRSEAVLFNLAKCNVEVGLEVFPRGVGTPDVSEQIEVEAGGPRFISDIYDHLGAPSESGMLAIQGPTLAWARTYNQVGDATMGQDLAPITPNAPYRSEDVVYFPFSAPRDVRHDSRSNLLIVNFEPRLLRVKVEADGATATVDVPANAFNQFYDLGKLLVLSGGTRTARVSANGLWYGVVSTTDPKTGDPTTVIGLLEGELEPGGVFIGVAKQEGGNGAHWRSEAVLFNPTTAAINAVVELTPRGRSAVVASKTVTLPASATETISDIYDFLEAQGGAGMVRIKGGALSWVRTFNQITDGTYGQEIPPAVEGRLFAPGERLYAPISSSRDKLTKPRSNFLAYNPGSQDVMLALNGGGVSRDLIVPAGTYIQVSNIGWWLGTDTELAVMGIAGTGAWFGYVSITDPISNDPTTVRFLSPGYAIPNRPPKP